MVTLFGICAGIGCIVLITLFCLTLVGVDHHGIDAGHLDIDDGSFFGMLSIRALFAAIAFFGLGGLIANNAGYGQSASTLIGLLAGTVALVVIAWIMRQLHRLQAQGNVHIEGCVGAIGKVYLSVPERSHGSGKVTVTIQNRTMEYQAITSKESLPTGTPVVVVGVLPPDTLEVEALQTKEGVL